MGCGSSKVAHSIVSIQHVAVRNEKSNESNQPIRSFLKTSSPTIRRRLSRSLSSSLRRFSRSSIQLDSDDAGGSIKSPTPIVNYKQIRSKLIDRHSFDYIDQSVSQVPFSESSTLDELSDFFSQLADSDILKVRCMWIWITQNIKHRREENVEETSPDDIIKKRLANSEGFAILFRALVRKCNIHCKTVVGLCKYYGDNTDNDPSNMPPHYWNIVYLNDNWFIVDTYWGAGYDDENKNFIKSYREQFFLADPSYFIYSHLPKNPTWQLIKEQVKKQTFLERSYISLHFSDTFIRFVSHENRIINTETKKIHIKFRDSKDIPIACEALLKSVKHESPIDCDINIYRTEKILHIVVTLPRDGHYKLTILGRKTDNSESTFRPLCRYEIIVKMTDKISYIPNDKFPILYKKHTPGFFLFSPKEGTLEISKNYHFKISLPDVSNVAICTGGSESGWYPMSKTKGTLWEHSLTLKAGTERVTVVAKSSKSTNTTYSSILAYQVSPST